MTPRKKQVKGIGWVLVAALTLTAGTIGYGIYSVVQDDAPSGQTLQQLQDARANTAVEVPAVPSIETTADLDKAQRALDQVNLDAAANDEKELESQANF